VDLNRIIVRAFGLRPFQVAAPDWTLNQRFDIQAAIPAGTTKKQFEEMLQNLLIDRFHLAFHREPRETSRYELVVAAGGPKLKDALDTGVPPEETAPGAGVKDMKLDKDGYPIRPTQGWSMSDGRGRFFEPHGGLDRLVLTVEMMMGQPVVDATGLKGTYEIEMHWVGESPFSAQRKAAMAQAGGSASGTAPDPGPRGPTIQQALRDQLGLRLELKKGPMETVVIDRVDRVPTGN
jgi:uncharacterized protein (TIGR03435 family)